VEIQVKVSVIIPVYNADKYVQRAVESALRQPQTGQVILVEDGSSDRSLEICRRLESEYGKVLLFRHDDNSNHGAGASRNLGIANAGEQYISFLDADDYYLEGRFSEAEKILESDPGIDGVYEAIGVHCHDEGARQVWSERGDGELTTMEASIPPGKLLSALIHYSSGNFHLDGLVIRRSCLWSKNVFYDELRVHQDTAMIIQLAHYSTLVPGRLDEPVAMRGIHDSNRYTAITSIHSTRMRMWKLLFIWSVKEELPGAIIASIFRNYLYFGFLASTGRFSGNAPRPLLLPGLVYQVIRHPAYAIGAIRDHLRRRSGSE
jgi:glycosyltransferase involved in cell wall biosynthesis